MSSINYILGVYVGPHGASATLLKSGIPIVSVQLERLLGIKRAWILGKKYNRQFAQERIDKDFQDELLFFEDHFDQLINYVFEAADIRLSDIDLVALEKRNIINSPFDSFIMDTDTELDRYFSNQSIVRIEHHQGHQAQAFYPSPFKNAAILTIDGRSWDKVERLNNPVCLTISTGHGSAIETLFESDTSLVSDYYTLSEYLFSERFAEGKMMGLSSYGAELLNGKKLGAELSNWVNSFCRLRGGSVQLRQTSSGVLTMEPGNKDFSGELWYKDIPPMEKHTTPSARQKLLAYICQKCYEENLINVITRVKESTGEEMLCIAGGAGLNSVANKKIEQTKLFKNIFVLPNCGDEGLSLGFALWAYHQEIANSCRWHLFNDFMGRTYSEAEIVRAFGLYDNRIKPQKLGNQVFEQSAELLSKGKIIGWFQGGAEFGPRALGHRSILANPCEKNIRDIVNKKVKFRESWRPFAPSIMLEYVNDYFDYCPQECYKYMLMVTSVKKEKRPSIPGVTHIDGSARVQVVDSKSNPVFYRLLIEFHKLSGVPLLLNTSLNIAGKPLVETPQQAIECFLNSQIDNLIIEDYLLHKTKTNGF